jgi:hypothetical protein
MTTMRHENPKVSTVEQEHKVFSSELTQVFSSRVSPSTDRKIIDVKREGIGFSGKSEEMRLNHETQTVTWQNRPEITLSSCSAFFKSSWTGIEQQSQSHSPITKTFDSIAGSNETAERVVSQGQTPGTKHRSVYRMKVENLRVDQLQDRTMGPTGMRNKGDGNEFLSLGKMTVSTDWRVSNPLSISGGGHTTFS